MDKTQEELVRNITLSIEDMWDLANLVRRHIANAGDIQKLRSDADHLQDLLEAYEALNLQILPKTTLWMANEMVHASKDIADGYERLRLLDL